MEKSYKRAVEILHQRRRLLRPSVLSDKSLSGLTRIPKSNESSELKGTPSILGMRKWLDELGHSDEDINRLNIIHIAGTKGKGSTCAFVDSFLRAHGKRTGFPQKIGLYTSPHLIHPEERIRINFQPLPKDLFAKYFFEVEDVLSRNDEQSSGTRPRFLQLFALFCIHTFIREGVDAAIFETHHGGEYDSTNVFEKPVVTAVTTLGLDHVKQLGSSLQSIAWHKAGIFKSGAMAFSSPQESEGANMLSKRASDIGVKLEFVDREPSLTDHPMQLEPDVQRTNCSLALAIVRAFLCKTTNSNTQLSSSDINQGIENFSWPGRFQMIVQDQFHWFLDGAHNEMSVVIAAEWFLDISKAQTLNLPVMRVLVFSLLTDQRDGAAVFERLAASLVGSGIEHVIFTTYEWGDISSSIDDTNSDVPSTTLQIQQDYANIWKRSHTDTNIHFQPTIKRSLDVIRNISDDCGNVQTLITGSQHLVGELASTQLQLHFGRRTSPGSRLAVTPTTATMHPRLPTHQMRLRTRPSSSSHAMHLRSYTNQSRALESQIIRKRKRQNFEEDFRSLAPATRKRQKRMPQFTLFPMLPAELRLMVWKFAIGSKPRSISLSVFPPGNASPSYFGGFRARSYQSEIPPLLHVNHESRELSNQIYTNWMQVIISPSDEGPVDQATIYINPAVDILHIEYHRNLNPYVLIFEQYPILRTFKHLAFDPVGYHESGHDVICDLFPDLEQITLSTSLAIYESQGGNMTVMRSYSCLWAINFKQKWREVYGNKPLPKLTMIDSFRGLPTLGRAVFHELKWNTRILNQLVEISKTHNGVHN
ncbi:MurD-like peptide ligase, catalytic [Glarea lozoyensis ATCC 20868]|uniref:tetrahydrofolate synthase n=1 Tax=Glarea lozoyensis (strain ATCC 20868 / MF5171) TaxID=1116229 RepID=S3D5S7_GLAL2|nr:MurD-like peptide ligase, catalytic [Glarea lozoyensis ATCC 20868]EPE27451.1 MurD-like peptide ligase, catalytic [Glarea lozoyensis ATCC 20868]